jgi:hypothetical protein
VTIIKIVIFAVARHFSPYCDEQYKENIAIKNHNYKIWYRLEIISEEEIQKQKDHEKAILDEFNRKLIRQKMGMGVV